MKTKPTQLDSLPRAQSQTPSRASNPQTQPQTKNSSTPQKTKQNPSSFTSCTTIPSTWRQLKAIQNTSSFSC